MKDEPWKNKALIKRLYHGKNMSGPEIADKLGCSVGPVYDRLDDVRSISEANKIWSWKLPLKIYTSQNGYERFQTKVHGKSQSFAHHRLLAVAEYGMDALEGNIVHHKNNIPWDNRIENLELMPQSMHVKTHFEEIPINDKIAMLEYSLNTKLTHREIAGLKGETRSTVNSIVARAKQ